MNKNRQFMNTNRQPKNQAWAVFLLFQMISLTTSPQLHNPTLLRRNPDCPQVLSLIYYIYSE